MSDKRKGAKPYDDLYREPGSGASRTGILVGAAIAVVVVIALVAIVVSSESGDDAPIDAVQETAGVVVEGEPLPTHPEASGVLADPATDPAVGTTPPTLVGEGFDGSEVTVDPSDGTPRVIIFAAHWCPVCQEEIPLIQEWIEGGNLPEGVEIDLVSTSARADGPEYPPSEWLSGIGWSNDVLLDNADQSAANSYGLTGYPYMVFVGGDGTVVARASGAVPIEDFDALVSELA